MSLTVNRSVIEKIKQYLERFKILKKSRILIAFSGGPDSTVLLHALHTLSDDFQFYLACTYIDHGIRKREEIKREIDIASNTVKRLNVPFYIKTIEEGKLEHESRIKRQSIEHVARIKRYQYLDEIRLKKDFNYIALGHNLDDHVETVIMRFFQGVNISGLCGIPPVREHYIRPLYDCNKKEILDYLYFHSLSYSVDSTNLKMGYLRNKIRNRLIPHIKKQFPAYKTSLKRMTEKIRLFDSYLATQAQKVPWREDAKSKRFSIGLNEFTQCHPVLRLHSVYRLITKAREWFPVEAYQIPYGFFTPLLHLSGNNVDGTVLKGYGLKLHQKGKTVFFERDVVLPFKKGYLIVVDNEVYIPFIDILFIFKKETDNSDREWPLIIRSKQEGDAIKLKYGRKKIKKILQEWSVPVEKRWKIPIVENKRGILMVLGKFLGYNNLYSVYNTFNILDEKSKIVVY